MLVTNMGSSSVPSYSHSLIKGRAQNTPSQVLSLTLPLGLFLPQVLRTNQFSVTRHEKVANGLLGDQGLPGVFVLYELSPMMVKLTEKHR